MDVGLTKAQCRLNSMESKPHYPLRALQGMNFGPNARSHIPFSIKHTLAGLHRSGSPDPPDYVAWPLVIKNSKEGTRCPIFEEEPRRWGGERGRIRLRRGQSRPRIKGIRCRFWREESKLRMHLKGDSFKGYPSFSKAEYRKRA